jgi:hypothetical protein
VTDLLSNVNLSVQMASFYSDPDGIDRVRIECASNNIKELVELVNRTKRGAVHIIDGSPVSEVRTHFENLGAIVFRETGQGGMAGAKREVSAHAERWFQQQHNNAINVCFWTEIEKEGISRHIDEILEPIIRHDVEASMPTRSDFDTLPWLQALSEEAGNDIYRWVTGITNADVFFGPLGFTARHLAYLKTCDPLKTYGVYTDYIHHALSLWLIAHGHKVAIPVIQYTYREIQTQEEEGPRFRELTEKRFGQLRTLSKLYLEMGRRHGLIKQTE